VPDVGSKGHLFTVKGGLPSGIVGVLKIYQDKKGRYAELSGSQGFEMILFGNERKRLNLCVED